MADSTTKMNRRSFLLGLIAAPAVIRVAPLMRISAPKEILIEGVPWQLYGTMTGRWSSRLISLEVQQLYRDSSAFIQAIEEEFREANLLSEDVRLGQATSLNLAPERTR